MKLFSGKTAGYGRLQLFSGAQPQSPSGTPTGMLLWEGPVEVEPERRTATAPRRLRGNGVRDQRTPIRRTQPPSGQMGRRVNDKRVHAERRSPSQRILPPFKSFRRRKGDERRGNMPRRTYGAVYGPQVLGKRKATIDRRRYCGITRAVMPDARIERRTGRPLMPAWVASAQAWVPVHNPRRRKGEERRKETLVRLYKQSPDPRIRALERRMA